MKNKKGALAPETLVKIILLIAGFAILILVFTQINWTGEIDREVCHQSVLLRATTPSAAKNLIPLRCKTSKLCINSGLFGGKCEDSFENSKEVQKIKVNDIRDVEKLISEEVVSCWSDMGEGKVSLFSQYWAETFGIGGVYPTCVIYSRIGFDEDLDVDLQKMDVLKYMREHKMPDKEISYFEYLAGEEEGKLSIDIDSMKIKDVTKIEVEGEDKLVVDEEDSVLISGEEGLEEAVKNPYDDIAIVFMQISAPGHGDSVLNLGKAALGLGIAGGSFAGPSLVAKGIKRVGLKGGLITLGAAILGVGAQQINVAYNRGVTAGYCGDISVGSEARNGCSVVRVVNYDKESIQKYCSVIESIA
jgi:hypothetical protein